MNAGLFALSVLALIDFIIMCFVGMTAESKGRRALPWMALSLFIGLFAFIPLLVAGLPEKERLRRVEADEQARIRVRMAE